MVRIAVFKNSFHLIVCDGVIKKWAWTQVRDWYFYSEGLYCLGIIGSPCGGYLELKIFCEGLADFLEEGEAVIPYFGYKGEEKVTTKGHNRAESLTEAAVWGKV